VNGFTGAQAVGAAALNICANAVAPGIFRTLWDEEWIRLLSRRARQDLLSRKYGSVEPRGELRDGTGFAQERDIPLGPGQLG